MRAYPCLRGCRRDKHLPYCHIRHLLALRYPSRTVPISVYARLAKELGLPFTNVRIMAWHYGWRVYKLKTVKALPNFGSLCNVKQG